MDFDDLDDAEGDRDAEDAAEAEEARLKAVEELKQARARTSKERAERGMFPLWEPFSDTVWGQIPKCGDQVEKPTTMKQFKEVVDTNRPGDFFGKLFPHSPDQLKSDEYGPKWLTEAMHDAGTLAADNKVVKFTQFDIHGAEPEVLIKDNLEDSNWGGAGIKILLSVEYEKDPGLGGPSKDMFIKMPHPFTGKNERYKNSVGSGGMDFSEVLFYNYFGGRLPVPCPRNVFCDFTRSNTNFITIIERVPYGKSWEEVKPGQMFPAPGKYRDWDYPKSGADFYYAHAKALAQFFGWQYNTKQETDQIERLFQDEGAMYYKNVLFDLIRPLDTEGRDRWFSNNCTSPDWAGVVTGSGFPPDIADGFLTLGQEFITKTAPHTFPAEYMKQDFLDLFFSQAREMSKYVAEMNFWDQMVPELWMLCHPNAQLDNAYYFRDDAGETTCGLLDFGGTSFNTISSCIGNGWMGAEVEMMDEHEEKLVKYFLDCYERETGFKFDFDDFYMHVKLTQATVFYGCCANVRWLVQLMKKDDWKSITGRKDKKVDNAFYIRCYYVQIILFIGMWKKRSPYNMWQKWMARARPPKK